MTVAMLKSHCKDFGLSQSGNKSVLRERLEAFSRDRDAWERCVSCSWCSLRWMLTSVCVSFPCRLRPGARKSHKGSRVSTTMDRTTRVKQSVQRRAQLLGTAISGTSIVTDRSKDMRTSAELAALLPWVSPFLFPLSPFFESCAACHGLIDCCCNRPKPLMQSIHTARQMAWCPQRLTPTRIPPLVAVCAPASPAPRQLMASLR